MPDNFENTQENIINTDDNISESNQPNDVQAKADNVQVNAQDNAAVLDENVSNESADEQPTMQAQVQPQAQPQVETNDVNVPPTAQPQQQAYNGQQPQPNMYGYNAQQPQYMPPQQPPYQPQYNPPAYGYNNPPYTNPNGYNAPTGYNLPYTNQYGYNPYTNGVHNYQSQQGYRYPQQPMQPQQPQYMPPQPPQPPRPQTASPYPQQNIGQAQSNNDALQNAEQADLNKQAEKKGKNKGFRVFVIVITLLFGLAVLALASYGVVAIIDDIAAQYDIDDSYNEQDDQPADLLGDDDVQPANPFEDNNGQQQNPFEQPNNGSTLPQTQNEPQANPSKFKLGIVVSPVTEEMQAYSNIIPSGLVIIGVEATSSLADADIEAYDIITEVDGKKITTTDQLHEYMNTKQEGDKLKLTIARIDDNNMVSYHEVEAELQVNENYVEDGADNQSSSNDNSAASSKPSL